MNVRPAYVLVVLVITGCSPTLEQPGMSAQAQGPFQVTGVVDGDTLTVDDAGSAVTVRLLGIDTPETVDPGQPEQCFGPEATTRAEGLLSGQRVWLETDPSQDPTDRYGRRLAYVWLPGDELVNLTLLEEGYAREYTYDGPYRYQAMFRDAQTTASHARNGLWSAQTCGGR